METEVFVCEGGVYDCEQLVNGPFRGQIKSSFPLVLCLNFCCCCFNWTIMKQHKLSASKRLTKPILFGTIIVGLAAAFINRYDVLHLLCFCLHELSTGNVKYITLKGFSFAQLCTVLHIDTERATFFHEPVI